MKLHIYADESGTFDKEHNDLFVYEGLVVPGDSAKRDPRTVLKMLFSALGKSALDCLRSVIEHDRVSSGVSDGQSNRRACGFRLPLTQSNKVPVQGSYERSV